MRIHKDFTGGNIVVREWNGDGITLENEIRDTSIDWFYWAFCAEGMQGRVVTFSFQPGRIGNLGPAVSYDLKKWQWLSDMDESRFEMNGEDAFTYRFRETEKVVYFAHDMLYHPDRFYAFAQKQNLPVRQLCVSRRGRSVPCTSFGDGSRCILLIARQHACESTGSYVLEGVIEEMLMNPIRDTRVFCVPFVDLDGVLDGDQGKLRIPHDHYLDYAEDQEPIYPETAAIRRYVAENSVRYAFDFHSPGHKGGEHDRVYIVREIPEKLDRYEKFGKILERSLNGDVLKYRTQNDIPPMFDWNIAEPRLTYGMMQREETELALILETTYCGTKEEHTSQRRFIELGRRFARALAVYMNQEM